MESHASAIADGAVDNAAAEEAIPLRRLEIGDHEKGFIELLGQLSLCPPVSSEEFRTRIAELAALGDDHVILVVEDPLSSRILATGSVFIERKFLRGCAKAGHIEDVVVDASARGRGLGQRVVRSLVEHAKAQGCYKVILDCKVELRSFYENFGFEETNVQMALYFNH